MIDKFFKNQKECREFIFEELKKELIGPRDYVFHPPKKNWANRTPSSSINYVDNNCHKQEVLSDNPKFSYIAGVLHPKKTLQEDILSEEDQDSENPEVDEIFKEENEEETPLDGISMENENEDETEDSDNENIIDLTNEMKPSAMSMTFCLKNLFDLIVEIKNIGQYYKIGKSETIPNQARVVACFISRYAEDDKSYKWLSNHFKLEDSQRNTCEKFLANIFNIKYNSFKNLVDSFDKFNKHRKGWETISKINEKIQLDTQKYQYDEFESLVVNLIKEQTINHKDEPIEYDGYFRKNINSRLIFLKDELNQNINKTFSKIFNDSGDEQIDLAIFVKTRKNHLDNLYYITVSLVNIVDQINKKNSIKNLFFQCNFQVSPANQNDYFEEYLEKKVEFLDEEQQSINLLHRNKKSYAIGHGCSANWKIEEGGRCKFIFSEVFPYHEIKPIVPQIFPDVDLDMINFSKDIDFTINELNKLANKYSDWLKEEKIKSEKFNEIFKKISHSNISKAEDSLRRIREGIEILKNDAKVKLAFQFMNLAIAHQQWHYDISSNQKDKQNLDFKNINYQNELIKNEKGKWYPFQIAFILLNIKSFSDPFSEDRNIVDLIWFPTGGGKTEAYLGLTAFVIFLRKINFPKAKGTAAVMRYTLRLLTTQQFQRASSLICACEKIRKENKNILGTNTISIGLWIGGDITPNTEKSAHDILESMQNKSYIENKFLILNCPWCGENLDDERKSGYRIENRRFTFVCPDPNCYFHENHLPIYIIDDTIYKISPDLIIGTVDKFASLPWKIGSIDCFENKEGQMSPDLIVQDELHLISGPLGSVAGMYEILIDAIFQKKINDKSLNCKIIASTATISRAEEQIKSLYARGSSLFPPQTNQIEDNFFAKEDNEADGRKYVGLYCSNSSSQQVTLAKIISSILISGKILENHSDTSEIYDPYWTQIIYFNSIRELMSGATLVNDDVRSYLQALYFNKGFTVFDQSYYRKINSPGELTSRVQSSEIPKILNNLQKKREKNKKTYPYDICLATNMIQVGIDIQRLSLMIINGQPKTTSEYIQASSRVGRKKSYPGIVFNILSPFKARDRSHYEHFKSYHQSLYNYVEPTSVTSHSDPVRKRALHAVVIGLCRLWGNNVLRKQPNPLPDNNLKKRIEDYILDYVNKADSDHPDELENTKNEIKKIFERWERIGPNAYGSISPDPNKKDVLMYPFGGEKIIEANPFLTLTSMRNVDKECSAEIIDDFRGERD